MSIEVRAIQKTFDKHVALKSIDLKVESGEMVALLGPSGSGKTTLLRVIAGLEPTDSGQVLFHGEDVHDQRVGDRRVGFVFQHYALFRHMSVFENVAFGLRCRPWKLRPARAEIREKVTELLRLVQLENFARRLPTQLSGGQRQRVALARALAIEPRVLLLDEPFGALDAQVRRELRGWIRRLHDRLGFTSIFVTHDQEEALEIADRIVVMRAGAIEQVGTPDEVYENPATSFVFQFLGDVNLFHGRLNNSAQYVRPHDVHVSREDSPDSIPAKVERIRRAGALVHIDLKSQPDDKPIVATLARDRFAELALQAGEWVQLHLSDVRIYEEEYSI